MATTIDRIETFLVPPRWLFVRVETEDGAVGWGEASLEGYARRSRARSRRCATLHRARPEPHRRHLAGGLSRGFTAAAVLMSALAGLEQALWDLKGKTFGLPAWEMLGGRVRDRVRAYAWIGGDRPDEIEDAAKARRGQGFSAVKMNATAELDWIGTPRLFDEVIKRVEAAQGLGMDVGLDFHGRVHRPMAKQLAKALEPLGLLFIEEPLLSENPKACADCRDDQHPMRSANGSIALGLQAVLRDWRGRHHPARPQPRGWVARVPQDRGHGRGL